MPQYQTYNFDSIVAGSYYNGTNFTLYTDKAQTTPLSLTGCKIRCSLRKNYLTPVVWMFSTEGDGEAQILITNAAAGKFSMVGCNMDIASGHYVYDIRIWFPDGEEKVYIIGSWTLNQRSTNG